MSNEEVEWEGINTKATHADQSLRSTKAISPPIWQTTTFSADSAEQLAEIALSSSPAEFYTRWGNPGHKQTEKVLAALEGAEEALVMSSGMGAIFCACTSVLRSGDHVVAQYNHYAGTTSLFHDVFPRWNIDCTFVEETNTENFAAAIRPNTKLIYSETPTNPLLRLVDLRAIAELGAKHKITTIVDNTFATPINQQPLALGIDVVVHSATKYLGGHFDVSAGSIVSSKEFIERAWKFAIIAGATLSPFDSWLLLRGLRTLGLRVERQNATALALARFLESHPLIARVNYPGLESHPQHALARRQMTGFGGVMSFELRDGYDAGARLISALKLAKHAASFGGYETVVIHPAAMFGHQLTPEQRQEIGISDGLIRVSVGFEDEQDLVRDFSQAIEFSRG
jgi:methionine-gamma-lyase